MGHTKEQANPLGYKDFEGRSIIDKKFLQKHLNTLTSFLNSPDTPDHMYDMAKGIANEIAIEFNPRLIILSGFPTYVMDIADREKRKIPEYNRFYETKYPKVAAMEGGMPCPSCIDAHNLNSFFPFCNTCKAPFKVRDMIELYPDIDMIMVLDQYNPDELAIRLDDFRSKYGYSGSVDDYENSLLASYAFMNNANAGIWNGKNAKKGIKLDMIAIPTDELMEGYKKIGFGDINAVVPLNIHRNRQMVLYPDNLGTELFVSRHIPPLYADEVGTHLYQEMEAETKKYVQTAGSTIDEAFQNYMTNLQKSYIKNYNIVSSSPELSSAVRQRIAKHMQ